VYLELIIVTFIVIFIIFYRKNTGDKFYKYISNGVTEVYNKYAPYSFKMVREKTKELGQEYTARQYLVQIVTFSVFAGVDNCGYVYSVFSIFKM